MKRLERTGAVLVVGMMLAGEACSGDDTSGGGPTADAGPDGTAVDSSTIDTGSIDSAAADSGPTESDAPDSNLSDTGVPDTGIDASGCPASWTLAPVVDPTIEIPDGGGSVLLHAAGNGTQNYQCQLVTTDGGSAYEWVFVGPQADLSDCMSTKIGSHFASDAGATRPEWQTVDGTYVIGKKLTQFIPDGGASAVPWLLLQEVDHGGTGTLAQAAYVQRLNTQGGIAPTTTCDATNVGASSMVTYGADYYFFGP